MACERKDTADTSSLLFTVPPYTRKGEKGAKNQTTFKVLGAITIIAIVVAGVVSVASMCLNSSSSGGSRLDGSKKDLIFQEHRKEFLLEFTLGGKSHKELIQVDEDQNLVTISDEDAGFSVMLDYHRGIAMMKNTSSSDCFFTRVEHIPDYQTNEIQMVWPIVVQEVRNLSPSWDSDNTRTFTLLRSNVIPPGYLQLTSNPTISKQCIDSASYWLEGIPPTRRQRRKTIGDIAPWLAEMPPPVREKRKEANAYVQWKANIIQLPQDP